ncbi:hypothetical protein O1M63_02250 [Streptomyces mirabilis]|nr:hypothetical protein [Streptomyces mirabilis]
MSDRQGRGGVQDEDGDEQDVAADRGRQDDEVGAADGDVEELGPSAPLPGVHGEGVVVERGLDGVGESVR